MELPGSRPLGFANGPDLSGQLSEWPVDHTVKCLAFYHPDDAPALRIEQQARLRALHEAARRRGLELMIEIIAGEHGRLGDDTVARVLGELYALHIKPDWWKLEPQPAAEAWGNVARVDRGQRSLVPRHRGGRAAAPGRMNSGAR